MSAGYPVVRELVRRLPERVVEVVLGHVGVVGADEPVAEGVQVELVLLDVVRIEQQPPLRVVVVLASDELGGVDGPADRVGHRLPSQFPGGEERDGSRRREGHGPGVGADDVVPAESGCLFDQSVRVVLDLVEPVDLFERLVEGAFPAVAGAVRPEDARIVGEDPGLVEEVLLQPLGRVLDAPHPYALLLLSHGHPDSVRLSNMCRSDVRGRRRVAFPGAMSSILSVRS